jgi:NTE family protein
MTGKLDDELTKVRPTALLFAGGGLRGAVQVGYARYIITDLKWPVRWVRGVSTGALQAVMLAHGSEYGIEALESLWLGLMEESDLFRRHGWFGKLLALLGKPSFSSNEPLRDLLRERVDFARLIRSGVDLRVGVTNFNTKRYLEVSPLGMERDTFLKFVIASTSIPGEFPGVYMDDPAYSPGWYFDGGVTNMVPTIHQLIKDGASRIVVCLCSPDDLPTDGNNYDSVVSAIKEALSITMHDNWTGDLEVAKKEIDGINALVESGHPEYRNKKRVDFIILGPKTDLPIGTLEVDSKRIRQTIDLGHRIAQETIEAHYGR